MYFNPRSDRCPALSRQASHVCRFLCDLSGICGIVDFLLIPVQNFSKATKNRSFLTGEQPWPMNELLVVGDLQEKVFECTLLAL